MLSMTIAKHDIKRILVDSGSSTNILFYNAFVQMVLPLSQLRQVSTSLVSFYEDLVRVENEITLLVTARTPPRLSTVYMTFTVTQIPSIYIRVDAIVSTKHLLIRFPTKNGVGKI